MIYDEAAERPDYTVDTILWTFGVFVYCLSPIWLMGLHDLAFGTALVSKEATCFRGKSMPPAPDPSRGVSIVKCDEGRLRCGEPHVLLWPCGINA